MNNQRNDKPSKLLYKLSPVYLTPIYTGLVTIYFFQIEQSILLRIIVAFTLFLLNYKTFFVKYEVYADKIIKISPFGKVVVFFEAVKILKPMPLFLGIVLLDEKNKELMRIILHKKLTEFKNHLTTSLSINSVKKFKETKIQKKVGIISTNFFLFFLITSSGMYIWIEFLPKTLANIWDIYPGVDQGNFFFYYFAPFIVLTFAITLIMAFFCNFKNFFIYSTFLNYGVVAIICLVPYAGVPPIGFSTFSSKLTKNETPYFIDHRYSCEGCAHQLVAGDKTVFKINGVKADYQDAMVLDDRSPSSESNRYMIQLDDGKKIEISKNQIIGKLLGIKELKKLR